MRISLLITIFVLTTSIVHAEIYTCKNASGETIYTDSPSQCANAEEIKVDTLPTLVPAKPVPIPASNRSNNATEDNSSYNELVITSPANDATLRDSQGNLTINFRAAPALQTRQGHKYIVSVNGAEVYSGTSTIAALKNVDRGTHTIAVKIIAADGSTKIAALPVKVTLHRFSALQNNSTSQSDSGAGGNGNSGGNTNSQSFPSNSKFPSRPASPPPSNN